MDVMRSANERAGLDTGDQSETQTLSETEVHYPPRPWGHALNKDNKERRLDSRLETWGNILNILAELNFDVSQHKLLFTPDTEPQVNEDPHIKSCSEMSLTNMEQHQLK